MTIYIVERTGELVECVNKDVALDSANVVIVISPSQKKIYTWMGSQAAPQSKFACARETARMRMETGYKIVNLEERDVNEDFIKAVDEIVANIPEAHRVEQYRPRSTFSSEAIAQVNEQRSEVSGHSSTETTATVKQKLLSEADSALLEKNIEEILEQLEKLPPISGKIRDYIIIREKLYVAPLEQGKWDELEEVMLDDGSFVAEDYISRILIQNGKVSAIELWRET